MIRFEIELVFCFFDYGFGGVNFFGDPCWRRFDIYDDCIFYVD